MNQAVQIRCDTHGCQLTKTPVGTLCAMCERAARVQMGAHNLEMIGRSYQWEMRYRDAERKAKAAEMRLLFERHRRLRGLPEWLRKLVERKEQEGTSYSSAAVKELRDWVEWMQQRDRLNRLYPPFTIPTEAPPGAETILAQHRIIKAIYQTMGIPLRELGKRDAEGEKEGRNEAWDLTTYTGDTEPVHYWFGLTYASWLTLPRVILEAMPIEWQQRFVRCLEELDETFDWVPENMRFTVSAKINGKYTRLPDHLCNYRRPDIEAIEALRIGSNSHA